MDGCTPNPTEAHDYGKDKATGYVNRVNECSREDNETEQLEVVTYKDFKK